jgi:Tfp pilus assembly protein PilF
VLRAHRARVDAARGDLGAAVATMRDVLSADPQYLDGWSALADWHLELRDFAAYLTAAEQLHRLAPNDPHALGYLAHANRLQGTRVDVRPWLQRALQLKPDYAWAAGELFDLELDVGNLDAARSVLETLKTHFLGRHAGPRGRAARAPPRQTPPCAATASCCASRERTGMPFA